MRRTLVTLTAAALMAAVPTPALAQTGSLGSLTGSGDQIDNGQVTPTPEPEPEPEPEPVKLTEKEQELYDAEAARNERGGAWVSPEASKAARELLPQILAGEFAFSTSQLGFDGGTTGWYLHTTREGTYAIWQISEIVIDRYIGIVNRSQPGRSDPRAIGLAVRKEGPYYYTVRHTPFSGR